MLNRTDKIVDILIEYFIKLNFNRKKKTFSKVHKNEFVYFFNDTVSKEININGIYEKIEINFLSRILKRNSTVIDIGANIGNHSIAFSKISKKVYSFEAHPKTFEILRFNCKEIKKIKIFNIGISNKKGFLFFKNKQTHNIGGKKLGKIGQIKSKINKLDNIIKINNDIGLIKIDIEGHEYQALQGMKKILKNNNSIILIEFFEKDIKKRKNIINLLKSFDYSYSYYFYKEKSFFKKKYLDLLKNIIFLFLFNSQKNKTKVFEITPNLLIKNDIRSNIIFSKKKLNLSKIDI